MIFKDKDGYPVNETLDGMDSAMRAGVMGTFFPLFKILNPVSDIIKNYEVLPGILARHPSHSPSNNPKNFTRDQMMCLVSALPPEINRRVFWATLRRGFFTQSTERDVAGSKKMKRPHSFYKDSRPTTRTEPMKFNWKGFKFENTLPEISGAEIEVRFFDGSDPLFPNHICHLILCARLYPLYPFFVIGWPLLALSCIFNSKELTAEQNQLQCMVVRAGKFWAWFYKKTNPKWEEQTKYYWDRRNEREYADFIIKVIGGKDGI